MRGIQRSNRNTFGVRCVEICDVAASGGKIRNQRPHRSTRHTVIFSLSHTACGVDQNRRIVSTGDGYRNGTGYCRSTAVRYNDIKLFNFCFTRGKIFNGRIGHRIGPRQLATNTGTGRVAVLDSYQCSQRTSDFCHTYYVRVCKIDVCEGYYPGICKVT